MTSTMYRLVPSSLAESAAFKFRHNTYSFKECLFLGIVASMNGARDMYKLLQERREGIGCSGTTTNRKKSKTRNRQVQLANAIVDDTAKFKNEIINKVAHHPKFSKNKEDKTKSKQQVLVDRHDIKPPPPANQTGMHNVIVINLYIAF